MKSQRKQILINPSLLVAVEGFMAENAIDCEGEAYRRLICAGLKSCGVLPTLAPRQPENNNNTSASNWQYPRLEALRN